MPKGGKKFRDQQKQQKELEEQGLKNILLKTKDKVVIDEKTGVKKLILSNERYGKITRNLGSKRYELIAEDEPGKPFTKHRVRKMGRLNHKSHRQKPMVNDIVLFYVDKDDKPDKDGFLGGEIFHKYSERETGELISREEISDNLWTQLKTENDTDEYVPFYFENDEVKSKEELKQETLEKANSGVYFDYNFNSDEESDSIEEEQTNITKKSDDSEETITNVKIDLDDI